MVRWSSVHDAGGVNTVVRAGVWKFNIGEVTSALVEDFVIEGVGVDDAVTSPTDLMAEPDVGVTVSESVMRVMMAESDVVRLDCFLSNGPGCLLTSKTNCSTKQEKQHDSKHFQISRQGNSPTYQSGAAAAGQGWRETPYSIGSEHVDLSVEYVSSSLE